VSTSWSLTVEECFYASAPLLFLGLAASRRRRGAAGSAAVLVAVTAGLYLAGSVIVRLLGAGGARALPFLSQEPLLRYYTVFGRFPDFALGVGAGLLFLSGSVERAWNRRSGAAWATVAAVAGVALLVAGEAGMARNGGSFAEWRWDLLVALASAVIVVALTCRHAPLSRLLSLRPAVYLGRVSYALYLIQLTPLGNGVLSRLLPGSDLLSLAGRYAGMNVIAAVLFELVEEPARETILAFRRRGSLAALPPARNRLAQGLSVAILFGGLAAQHVVWALASLRPVEETRVMQVLGAESEAVVRANVSPPAETRPPRLRLPPSWQEGPVGDRWAPRSLLVFVDGHPVPFLGARPPDSGEIAAYYHGRRAGQLSLRLAQPAQVTVVNHTPLVALALAWSRLGDAPLLSIAPLLLLGAAAAAVCWSRRSRPWSPRVCLACATCLVLAWLLCGLHLQEWAPLVLLIELTALTWLVLVRGPSPRLEGHLARD
jgi:peptidoglycan/LPS O-acetylase OafA/YrhL